MIALHAALNAISAALTSDSKQALVAAKCRGLMRGYDARWGSADIYILSVEQVVESPLFNPDTQIKSRTFRVAGKLDLVGDRNGRRVLMDHKTTSEDIQDPNSVYWRQLVIEAQPSHYMLLEWLNGRQVDEAVWDVIRKPDIRPKGISKKDRQSVHLRKQYFGEISDADIAEMDKTERETLNMYEARLAYDCVQRPAYYFQRRTVTRLNSDLHEHAEEIWDYSQEIIVARRLNRHPKNSGACITYGRPCNYLGICSGYDDPGSDKWRRKKQVHPELPTLEGDGRDVLTNSRLTVFKTCRRKHYYQYEIGIERTEEQEVEALYFGQLWHLALEHYFKAKQGEYGYNNTDSTANAVVTV